ncbi:MAG: metallophosphoesterase [Verrucomicrobiota bacterium]
MNLSRRKWLLRLGFYGTPAACFGYGSLVEKNIHSISRVDIPVTGDRRDLHGLKIALLSDFHHDDFGNDSLIRRAAKSINEESVDIVMLTGDYISNEVDAMEPLCEALADLRPRLGSFAVLGNHDRWSYDEVMPRLLEQAGIRLLINEAVDFPDFAVAGLDSYWGGSPDLVGALSSISPDKPVIMGWHEPDPFDSYDDPRIALQLSGHTHGGQICAPVYGPILLPRYGKKYPFGYYQNNNRSLYVTRGIGTLDLPTRFLCAPEVAILTMRDFSLSMPI